MYYLKLFQNHTEYEEAKTSGLELPNVSHCINEAEVHYNPYVHDYSQDYFTFVAKEDGTFQLSTNGVSYSLDNGETWTELAAATASPTVTVGNKIMWKGTMTPQEYYGIGTFSSTANFDIQGNIMSLLYGDNYKGQTDLTEKDYAFCNLFRENTKIINAERLSLPATTLADSCYNGMFLSCTSLVTAPELPATALKYYCYQSMFQGCTSLTTAPELPATALAGGCYSTMFRGCTSLVNAPALPATTLATNCYDTMFRDCTSLVNAPELPATRLVQSCYNAMFRSCTNLNYIKAMFTTTPSTTYTSNWVNGVAANGTFVKNSAATWNVSGNHGIPNGWTVETASA